MKIYLARHGQDEDNARGILNGLRDKPLTEVGRQQATFLANEILKADLKFDKVLCSPLVRAKETAEIISLKTDNPIPEIEQLLIERDFGIMTGLNKNKIRELCQPKIIETEKITYFLEPEGAETFPDLIARADQLIAKIKNNFLGLGSLLLVGHGDMGKMIYASFYGLDWKKVLEQFHFGNSELLLLSEGLSTDETHVFKTTQYNS